MIETKYQTFWKRLCASWVDGIVFIPFIFIDTWIYNQEISSTSILIYYIFTSLSIYIYSIIMHGYYGQTVGKMALNIKLYSVSEERLGFKRSVYRDTVPIVFTLIFITLQAPEILNGINPDTANHTFVSSILIYVIIGWYISEFITMLFNNKRRALHDFIAGSVVVRL